MFSIKCISDEMGKIQVDGFEEEFELTLDYWSKEHYEKQWKTQIQRLINSENNIIIGLMTWMHKPGVKDNYRSWVLYREGKRVFVQEILFPANNPLPCFDENESLINAPEREEVTEEGEKISQWETSVADLEAFVKNSGGNGR